MARQFIVKDQDRYYVCEAVMEYDPAQAKTADQSAAIQEVAAMFDQACKSGGQLVACPFTGDKNAFGPLNTGFPPPPR